MKQSKLKKILTGFLALTMILGNLSPMAYVDASQEAQGYLTISDFKAEGEIASTSSGTTTYTTEKSLIGTSFKTKITYQDVVGTDAGCWWNAMFYGSTNKEGKDGITVFANRFGEIYAYINGNDELGGLAAKKVAVVPENGTKEILLEVNISAAVAGKSTITIKVDGTEALKKENVDTSSYMNQLIIDNDAARVSAVYQNYEEPKAKDYLTISDFKAEGEISATSSGTTTYTTEKSLIGTSFKTKITYQDVVGTDAGCWWNAMFYGSTNKEGKDGITVFANRFGEIYAYINGNNELGGLAAKKVAVVPEKGNGTLELLLEIDISQAVGGKSTITIKVDGTEALKKENVDTSSYPNQLIIDNDSARVSAVYRNYGVQNQNITTVTVDRVVSDTKWKEGDGWHMYLGITEPLQGFDAWVKLEGMKYTLDGGAEQDLTIQTGEPGQLYFNLPDLGQNVENKILTIKGQAMLADGSKGIKFAEPVTLYGTIAGWSLTQSSASITTVTVDRIVSDTKWKEGDGWHMYLGITTPLDGFGAWVKLTGMKYSLDGGAEQDLTIQTGEAGQLYFNLRDLGQNVENKVLTIKGQAMLSDGSKGIQLSAPLTIYGDASGWCLSKVDYIKSTVASINHATKFMNEKWYVYLNMNGDFTNMPYEERLNGFRYSINGGEEQPLTGCDWQKHDNGTLFFTISQDVLPKDITENTKLTISGSAKLADETVGISLKEDIVIYINESGWSVKGYLPPVQYITAKAEAVNYATCYKDGKWLIYLDMKGDYSKVPFEKRLSGFQYSINGGTPQDLTSCDWQKHEGGTLFFTISELPKDITKNTTVTISGKAKTNDGAIGLELTSPLTLYANADGWALGGYPKPVKYIQASAKSINYATKYINDRWYIYLDMYGNFANMPYEKRLNGFEYSINGGERKELTTCDWQRHEGGTLFFTLSELPEKITKNTKITIYGKAKINGGIGIKLMKDIVIYGNQYGLELGKYKKAPVYTDITVTGVNTASGFVQSADKWYIYLTPDKKLPGEVDSYFQGLELVVNGKKYDVTVQHALHEGTLCFPVEKTMLAENAKNGASITLKAGKALQQVAGVGINLKKDVTIYKFYDTLTFQKPTTKTTYTDITFTGITGAVGFIEGENTWAMEFAPLQELPGENGTRFYYINAVLNGKKIQIKGINQDGKLLIRIPENMLSRKAKTATLTLKAGNKAVGGYGNIGIHIKEDVSVYLFNGLWSDEKFDKMKEVELFCTRLFNFVESEDTSHLYFYVNSEFPGKAWYNNFKIPVEINGKKVTVKMAKADSPVGKILYLGVSKADVKIKEGTVLKLKAGTAATSGGYKITIKKDFEAIFTNGMWLENRQTDVKAPKAQNLWDVARFDEGYIPTSEDGTVLMSGEDAYNKIVSTERMKDFTISFSGEKIYNDGTSPSFYLILRGTPISEDDPISQSMLNGYVITFEGAEYNEEDHPDNPDLWGIRTCHINIWKNGANNTLRDQYCIGTYHNKNDNPYFKYEEAYNYEVSVYNITETVACIELRINGKLAYKCYDEAGVDPADPAINAGIFGIYGVAPTYYGGETVELGKIIAEKTECKVGEEVRLAVTYPSVLKGVEFTVDKEGAIIENGKFGAIKPGTYTISAKYNGKELEPITITVKERAVAADDEVNNETPGTWLTIVLIAAGVILISGGVATALVLKSKKKKKAAQPSEE